MNKIYTLKTKSVTPNATTPFTKNNLWLDTLSRYIFYGLTSFILLLSASSTYGQNKKIDSLKTVILSTELVDTLKLHAYCALSIEYQSLDKDSSHYYIKKAVSLAKNSGDSAKLVDTYQSLGQYYLEANELINGKQILGDFVELFKVNDSSLQKNKSKGMKAYRTLSSIDSLLGNYEESLKNLKNYHYLKNRLLDEENENRVQELEKQYQIEEKGKEIELLSTENEIQELTARQQQRFIAWILGISILLIVFLVVLYNRYLIKKKSMAIIEEKSRENEVLVQEVHHRVKNNLQIMLSLLNTQINLIEDERAKAMVTESGNRIKSMALIHQNLYQSGNIIMVQARSYFEELTKNVADSFINENQKIDITTNIITEEIRMTIAVPLGLILNELITNAYKYAFKGRDKGKLTVIFQRVDSDNHFHLQITDDGNGLPEDFRLEDTQSFGLKLVNGLTEQLDGEVEVKSSSGTQFDLFVYDKETM